MLIYTGSKITGIHTRIHACTSWLTFGQTPQSLGSTLSCPHTAPSPLTSAHHGPSYSNRVYTWLNSPPINSLHTLSYMLVPRCRKTWEAWERVKAIATGSPKTYSVTVTMPLTLCTCTVLLSKRANFGEIWFNENNFCLRSYKILKLCRHIPTPF